MHSPACDTAPTCWQHEPRPAATPYHRAPMPHTRRGLFRNRLAGPLPAQVFGNHSQLSSLYLEDNCFTGALPDAYAGSQVWGWRHCPGAGGAAQRAVSQLCWQCSGCAGSVLIARMPSAHAQIWACLVMPQVRTLVLRNNSLAGPAIPPAWLEPGAMSNLEHLDISMNPGLSGTLPANLPWPRLRDL